MTNAGAPTVYRAQGLTERFDENDGNYICISAFTVARS